MQRACHREQLRAAFAPCARIHALAEIGACTLRREAAEVVEKAPVARFHQEGVDLVVTLLDGDALRTDVAPRIIDAHATAGAKRRD